MLRLPVATGSNYTGGDDSPAIPLNVDGIATGSLSVLAVNASDRLIPSAPALGDNYVTGWKADGASDEAFVLANDDEATIAAGLYLKRVEDPGANDGSYYMWQVAKKPSYRVTYEFVSGTKDKGLPQEVTDLLPIDPGPRTRTAPPSRPSGRPRRRSARTTACGRSRATTPTRRWPPARWASRATWVFKSRTPAS